MHCDLLVPALFAADASDELPAIERLLARARASSSERSVLQDWLHQSFDLGKGPHPAGALTVLGSGGEPGEACWTRADPVHMQVLRDRLVLVPGQALGVTREEAAALCESLNRHFAGTFELNAVEPLRWCARLAEDATFEADCPLDAAGRDVGLALATGRGAPHRLLNEAQMLLHSHPVNETREARGAPPINSLWLWGAGRKPRAAASRWRSVSSDEPVALGLARLARVRLQPLPASAAAWLDQAPEDGRHLVVLDSLRAPLALGDAEGTREARAALERGWFAPLLSALRAGRIGMLSIHVPDGPECMAYETIRGDLRKFWRRPRRLHEYA